MLWFYYSCKLYKKLTQKNLFTCLAAVDTEPLISWYPKVTAATLISHLINLVNYNDVLENTGMFRFAAIEMLRPHAWTPYMESCMVSQHVVLTFTRHNQCVVRMWYKNPLREYHKHILQCKLITFHHWGFLDTHTNIMLSSTNGTERQRNGESN